jgi:ketosteroid isomerase-like protein
MSTVASAEAEIQEVVEGLLDAMRRKDVDRVMSFYAKDVVAFDAMGPLRYDGADAYRKAWEDAIGMMTDAFELERTELTVFAGDDVAVAFAVDHMQLGDEEMWLRWTAGLRRIGRAWKIVHEHGSVPMDPRSGKALTDVAP